MPTLVAFVAVLTAAPEFAHAQAAPTKSFAQLESALPLLGEGWNGPEGYCLEDVKPDSLIAALKQYGESPALNEIEELKIHSIANWGFSKKETAAGGSRRIRVSIIRFQSRVAADNWWANFTKENDVERVEIIPNLGEKAIRGVSKLPSVAFTNERVLLDDATISVTSMTEPGETCRKVLVHYLNQLQPKTTSERN